MRHKYLVMRTMVERNPNIKHVHELRELAQIAHNKTQKEAGSDVPVPALREVGGKLCWFLLR